MRLKIFIAFLTSLAVGLFVWFTYEISHSLKVATVAEILAAFSLELAELGGVFSQSHHGHSGTDTTIFGYLEGISPTGFMLQMGDLDCLCSRMLIASCTMGSVFVGTGFGWFSLVVNR